MGNAPCCVSDKAAEDKLTTQVEELTGVDAAFVFDSESPSFGLGSALNSPVAAGKTWADLCFRATLKKEDGVKLGLDVDYMVDRKVLPVMAITGGLAEAWNKSCPEGQQMMRGDSIIEANGTRDDVAEILEHCKHQKVIELVLVRGLNFEALVDDLEKLIKTKGCGPLMIRLSWHDAGFYSAGDLTGGCPNAALRFKESGEGAFAISAGLPTVALSLLAPITSKYCPYLISHADLWTLAANTAIRVMGGPDIPTKFGRTDAKSGAESVESQVGRLPDGDKGVDHLRMIFHPKGFDDKAIVALSGAHTVGRCHADRSGFEGAWTEEPLRFDNSYFIDLLNKAYTEETSSKGMPQHRSKSGTIMLISDLALIQDPAFKKHVETYAGDKNAFFNDFTEAVGRPHWWERLMAAA